MSGERPHAVVLFDDVCVMCNRFVRFVLKRDHDGTLRFASLASDTGADIRRRAGVADDVDSIVLVEGDRAWTHSSATLEILRRLGGIWRILAILRFIPRPLRDGLYRAIARRRYQIFGKRRACMVPPPEQRSRFLG